MTIEEQLQQKDKEIALLKEIIGKLIESQGGRIVEHTHYIPPISEPKRLDHIPGTTYIPSYRNIYC